MKHFLTVWSFVKDELEAQEIGNKHDTSAGVLRTTVVVAQSQQSEIASLSEGISASALKEMLAGSTKSVLRTSVRDTWPLCEDCKSNQTPTKQNR